MITTEIVDYTLVINDKLFNINFNPTGYIGSTEGEKTGKPFFNL